MLRPALIALLLSSSSLVGLTACPPSTDDAGEGEGEGGEGEGEDDCAEGLPAPSDPCIPVCGNEQHVGQPCSEGGGECNEYLGSGAGFCTADVDRGTTLFFCTRPCEEDSNCGTNAVCRGDPAEPDGPKGCIPAACDEPTGGGEGEGEDG